MFPLKQWELRGDMQRCAHEWQGSGMCVGQWPGVSIPKPLSQRLTMNPHKVGAPKGHRAAAFVPHFKTHKHLLIKRQPLGPMVKKKGMREGRERGEVKGGKGK